MDIKKVLKVLFLYGLLRFAFLFALFLLTTYFCFLPAVLSIYYVHDSALQEGGMPKLASQLHQKISPEFEQWAKERIDQKSGKKATGISGTEWPLFSAVFYLWATENLQEAYQSTDSNLNGVTEKMPSQYAKGAIEQAARLLTDSAHTAWVKADWGDDYLHKENVFYRALLIGGLDSYWQISGDTQHVSFQKTQTLSLAKELHESKVGLLHDFPNECYPADVLMGYYAIAKSAQNLDLQLDTILQHAKRGFTYPVDPLTNLPPFRANLEAIEQGMLPLEGSSRGSSTALMCMLAPTLWGDLAAEWFATFETQFWQQNWLAYGFREYSLNRKGTHELDWGFDIDGGPNIAGHGITASAFGCGAARTHGRYDLAYPLAAEMITLSLPNYDGSLRVPALLSDLADAPLVGELGILFNLTRTTPPNYTTTSAKSIPLFVYLIWLVLTFPSLFFAWKLWQ